MASFRHQIGRRTIFFSDHALDRWWQRFHGDDRSGRQAAMNELRRRLAAAIVSTDPPAWARVSLWHRARAEMYLLVDAPVPVLQAAFVINRNANGDRVACTCLIRGESTQRTALAA
jgi:hypothetical protein